MGDDMKSLGGQVFVRDEPEQQRRRPTIEPTQEELSAARSSRLQTQTNDPNYLKDTPKASPSRERPDSGLADIPIQTIDLEVPLHIPGLASTDSYYNLSETGSNTGKKAKKKKKKAKKVEVASSDSEEAGPNVFVSRNIDLPEGASISDLDRSDSDDKDDPHKALGNIVLDDFLDPLPVKKKSDNLTVSPELTVEHKTHKKKKKEKKKKSSHAKEDVDLLGLETVTNGQEEEKESASSKQHWSWSGETFSLSLDLGSCRVEAEESVFSFSCQLSVTNTGPTKLSALRIGSAAMAGKSSSLAKSLKCGATKSKAVSLALTGGEEREDSVEVCFSWEGENNQQLVKIPLPSPAWLVCPPPCYDMEQYAELLLSGRLQHSAARQLTVRPNQPFATLAQTLASGLNLGVVEIQESSACLYGEVVGSGGQLAFMLKLGSDGGIAAFEGRCIQEHKELLAGVLDWASQLL